jgi:phosphate starvation-inducible PhoH-like protein
MSRKPSVKPRNKKVNLDEELFEKPPLKSKNGFDLLSSLKLDIKFKNDRQKSLYQSIKDNDVTICVGPAGTGKSYIAIGAALNIFKDDNKKYKNILLLKSMAQLDGETLPALPGDASEKMRYQNASFFDSLIKLVGEKIAGDLANNNTIKFDVIGSFRGRSISNSIIILDEVQNISHDNLKTILTRISDDTKIVLLGDPDQIDIRNKKASSLATLVKKVNARPSHGVGIIEFTEDDIVRHRLTSYFIGIFKEKEKPIDKTLIKIKDNPKKDKKFSGIINFIRNFSIK